MQKTNLELRFGPLADPLEEQLSNAGLYANPLLLDCWQKDADALARLSVRGILKDKAIEDGRNKLIHMISDRVEEK